jgi:hypothetical protein
VQVIPEPQAPSEPHASRWRVLPLLLILLFVGIIIALDIHEGELHFNSDEMRHAFTGVFMRDLMVDRPSYPIGYAYLYYAKYPALGVPHWPPLFYVVEGVFFLLFGISVVTSRVVILLFALMGIAFFYGIALHFGPRCRAVLAALIMPLMPYMLLYERATMLEIPMIALCLGTLYFWLRFLATERSRYLWMMALFLAAAMLTSQKSVVLVPIIVLHFVAEGRWRMLLRWQVWAAGALSVALVLPWYWLTTRVASMTVERMTGAGMAHTAHYEHWLFYPYYLHSQVGLKIMLLGSAGLVWALLFAPRKYRLLIIWVFCTYLFFSLLPEKDLRHTMIWIPPLVYLALLAIEVLLARRRWALLASAALALNTAGNALLYDRPRLSGVEAAARFISEQPDADIIYYQGSLNGNFIFYTRKYDPMKTRMVARDKQVYATRIVDQFGTRQILSTPEQVIDLFRTWGIRYALIQNRSAEPGLEPVKPALATNVFQHIAYFPIHSTVPEADGQWIDVYRYTGPIERETEQVVIPMLTLRDHIRVRLHNLVGQPWPREE